jgi:ABC-type multidrug transport system fused ATPase/permease subunit
MRGLDANSRMWFAASTVCGVALAAVDAGVALALREVLGAASLSSALVVGLVGLVGLRGLVHLAQLGASHLGRETLATALRHSAARALLLRSNEDARLETTIRELVDLHPRALVHAQTGAASVTLIFQILVLSVAALGLAPSYAPAALLLLGLVGLTILAVGRAIQARGAAASGAHQSFLRDVQRIVVTLPLLRALRLEDDELRRAEASIAHYAARSRRAAVLSAMMTVTPTLAGAPVLALVLSGTLLAGASPSSAVAFALVLVRMVLLGSNLTSTWATARTTRDAFERVESSFKTPSNMAPGPSPRPALRAPSLELLDVAIEAGGRVVAQGLTATIEPGQHLGIVGATGAGKSTLLSALMGLRSPARGTIAIAGTPPAQYLAQWRPAYVGPSPFMFPGTLRENLAFGSDPAPDDATMVSALREAAADDLTVFGLDRMLGEDGAPLSSGERQRVALARALASRARLVFLDEPTAHLDTRAGATVAEAIRKLAGHTTCVIVTHHPDALVTHCATTLSLRRLDDAPGGEDEGP